MLKNEDDNFEHASKIIWNEDLNNTFRVIFADIIYSVKRVIGDNSGNKKENRNKDVEKFWVWFIEPESSYMSKYNNKYRYSPEDIQKLAIFLGKAIQFAIYCNASRTIISILCEIFSISGMHCTFLLLFVITDDFIFFPVNEFDWIYPDQRSRLPAPLKNKTVQHVLNVQKSLHGNDYCLHPGTAVNIKN